MGERTMKGEWAIGHEDGWTGAFTRHQADDAIPNGTTIVKTAADPGGDFTPVGARGTVLGSIDAEVIDAIMAVELKKKFDARFLYWIEWEHAPKTAVACVDHKIAKLS